MDSLPCGCSEAGPCGTHGPQKDNRPTLSKGSKVYITDGERIASVYTEDNARLIAAAPDLYEACQAAFVLLSEYAPIWAVKVEDQLREALAKARG